MLLGGGGGAGAGQLVLQSLVAVLQLVERLLQAQEGGLQLADALLVILCPWKAGVQTLVSGVQRCWHHGHRKEKLVIQRNAKTERTSVQVEQCKRHLSSANFLLRPPRNSTVMLMKTS